MRCQFEGGHMYLAEKWPELLTLVADYAESLEGRPT
jgi:hypothetical protein